MNAKSYYTNAKIYTYFIQKTPPLHLVVSPALLVCARVELGNENSEAKLMRMGLAQSCL